MGSITKVSVAYDNNKQDMNDNHQETNQEATQQLPWTEPDELAAELSRLPDLSLELRVKQIADLVNGLGEWLESIEPSSVAPRQKPPSQDRSVTDDRVSEVTPPERGLN